MSRTQRRRFARIIHRRKVGLLRAFLASRKIVKVCDMHAMPRVAQ